MIGCPDGRAEGGALPGVSDAVGKGDFSDGATAVVAGRFMGLPTGMMANMVISSGTPSTSRTSDSRRSQRVVSGSDRTPLTITRVTLPTHWSPISA